MSNGVQNIVEKSGRVLILMSWLGEFIRRQDLPALEREHDSENVWNRFYALQHMEAELKSIVASLSNMTMAEVDVALEERRGDD